MIDCKTDVFFLKVSKEIGKVWREEHEPHTRVCGLLFDCSLVLECAKLRTVLQSKSMIVSDDKFIDSKWSLRVKLGNQ